MKRVAIYHLDGTLPNLALMRIASHHNAGGDQCELFRPSTPDEIHPGLYEKDPDVVYASAIFEKTRPMVNALLRVFPEAHVGGTGVDLSVTLEDVGISGDTPPDYSIYPDFRHSIGFSQRGCRLRCEFCVVPTKEGKVRAESPISEIWRGDPWPRQIILLDNDFFGQKDWRSRIDEIREGNFAVSFCQGINVRIITEEIAEAVASVNYRTSRFTSKRLYCAWDNRKDEKFVFRGLEKLVAAGVKPHHLMVYMLIGYWDGETHEDRDYRRAKLREFGAVPYPMPYQRTPELVGFQRWCITGVDKTYDWETWRAARWQKRGLPIPGVDQTSFDLGGEV